jgi:hypothetical protein
MTYPNQRKTETCELNGKTFKTHYWYMDCAKELTGSERHRMYYAQFCTPAVIASVRASFSAEQWAEMIKSYQNGDLYLNDCTELRQWDRIDVKQMVGRLVTDCTYEDAPRGTMYWSPSQNTCITKEAARMIIEAWEVPV